MDYEKKYKEGVEWLRDWIYLATTGEMREQMEKHFPELKESDDERVRKAMIDFFKHERKEGIAVLHYGVNIERMISWLEKQGESSIYNTPSRGVILAIWDLGNEWKELTNGSISTEYGTQLDYIQKHWQESEYYLRAMQGEQKSADKVVKFNVGDKVYNIKNRFECTIESIDDTTYYCDTTNFDIKDQNNWELIEQKPTNKVEPKFKVGDWITNGDYTWKIVEAKPLDYILQTQDGNIVDDTISHVDEQFHSFTIEDAKDGDVLVDEDTNVIGIFEGIEGMCWHSKLYYSCYTKELYGIECGGFHLKEFAKPATKEQRDTLTKAMADAGYTFDFEKKELKKIEQKPSEWSDKDFMYDTLSNLTELKDRYGEGYGNVGKCIDWLKSLRPQSRWKQSEQEKAALRTAIRVMTKERSFPLLVSHLQNILDAFEGESRVDWKPSKGQMEALKEACNEHYNPKGELYSLYEQLKAIEL